MLSIKVRTPFVACIAGTLMTDPRVQEWLYQARPAGYCVGNDGDNNDENETTRSFDGGRWCCVEDDIARLCLRDSPLKWFFSGRDGNEIPRSISQPEMISWCHGPPRSMTSLAICPPDHSLYSHLPLFLLLSGAPCPLSQQAR